MSGFRFAEQLRGSYTRVGTADARPIALELTAFVDHWWRYVADRKARLEGSATLDGEVDHAPARGEMLIDPLIRRVIRYELTFASTVGERLRLHGQKELSPLRLLETLTTLPAIIDTAEGSPWGTAELYFDMGELKAFLKSFRLT